MLRLIHWCGSMCWLPSSSIHLELLRFWNFFLLSHITTNKRIWTDDTLLKLQDQEIPWTDWGNYECRGWVDLYHGWKEVMEQTTYSDGIPGIFYSLHPHLLLKILCDLYLISSIICKLELKMRSSGWLKYIFLFMNWAWAYMTNWIVVFGTCLFRRCLLVSYEKYLPMLGHSDRIWYPTVSTSSSLNTVLHALSDASFL